MTKEERATVQAAVQLLRSNDPHEWVSAIESLAHVKLEGGFYSLAHGMKNCAQRGLALRQRVREDAAGARDMIRQARRTKATLVGDLERELAVAALEDE